MDIDTPNAEPVLNPLQKRFAKSVLTEDADYQTVVAYLKWYRDETTRLERVRQRDELRAFLELTPSVETAKRAAEIDCKLLIQQGSDSAAGFGYRNIPWLKAEWDKLYETYAPPIQLERLGNPKPTAIQAAFQRERLKLDR